jgi:spore coat protein CotH
MTEQHRDPDPEEQPSGHRPSNDDAPDGQPSPEAKAKRRVPFRHRIPVRLRHYWKTVAAVAAGFIAVVLVFGGYTVKPYITSQLVSEDTVTNDIAGQGDLFDGKSHSIEISYDEAEYEDMMATFQDEGDKDYIKADLTIDGTLIEDVGMRLKGNSTLRSLQDGGDSAGGDGMPGGGGDDAQPGAAEQGAAEPGGGGMVQLSADSPQELPWLISFDEYVEGRSYQGHTEIALRPAASGSDTALNEALALSLTAESGQTTQDYSFTSVSVNGGDSAARLVLDAPDAQWADAYGNGVLYKGRADGSFDYLGEDPTDYEDSFKQINAEGSYDLQPVMNLLDFVNNSDDEEFAAELDDHVDVESFAEYLATQELLSNADAMDGPGNNYYLWYDTDEEKFTVLSWDLNMALSGMGGGGAVPGGQADEASTDRTTGDADTAGTAPDGEDANANMTAGGPAGEEQGGPDGQQGGPDGQDDGPGEPPGGGASGDEGGGGSRGSGVLKERVLDNDDFHQLYEDAYAELYSELVEDGSANSLIERIAENAAAAGDEDTQAAVASLEQSLSQIRAEAPEESTSMSGGAPGR